MIDNIAVYSEEIDFEYQYDEQLISWIKAAITEEQQQLESLNIIFCSDPFLLNMNKEYLNHDYFTDIITFDYATDSIEGELYISLDRIRENATDLEVAFEHELHRVIIHGVLHLCGYGDKTDEEISIMRAKEDAYLKMCEMV